MEVFQKNGTRQHALYYLALIVSALVLLIPALYNHYPIVNPDTGTYLASGFKPETPIDRPITYGLLIRLFSINGLSLWPVVFAQAYMVSWLVFKIFQQLSGAYPYLLKVSITIFFLSVSSSLSWIVSQVQPDVFTPIALLCITLILLNETSRATNIIAYTLFFIAVACHLSHPMLFVALLLCLLVLKRFFVYKNGYKVINKKILTLIILSALSIGIMGAALSKSRHVFFMGSLLDKGVLKKYLDDNCAGKGYSLCAYKDSLPQDADHFWWDSNSPFYKMGGWKGTKMEYNHIIRDVLTTPAYLKLFAVASARQSLMQAVTFTIGDGNFSFPTGSNVNKRITEYFPSEVGSFNNAVQNTTFLWGRLAIPNNFFAAIIILSLLAFAALYVTGYSISMEMNIVFLVCAAGIILNCLDCATFGTVNGRYGCKMYWLVPFCTLVYATMGKRAAKQRH